MFVCGISTRELFLSEFRTSSKALCSSEWAAFTESVSRKSEDKVSISCSTFYKCSSSSSGGGLYIKSVSEVILDFVTFDSCSSSGQGGGAKIDAPISFLTFTSVCVHKCSCPNNGPALHCGSGSSLSINSTLTNVVLDQNFGGRLAMDFYHQGTATVTNFNQTSTNSANQGFCFLCSYARLDLQCSTFVSNKKQTSGTISLHYSLDSYIKMTNFVDNDGAYPIFNFGSSNATATECYFHQTHYDFGSGISVSNCRFFGIGPSGNSNNNRDGSIALEMGQCIIPKAKSKTPNHLFFTTLIDKLLLLFLG